MNGPESVEAPLAGVSAAPAAAPMPARNRFGRLEWAGAFGDLGTLIPFVVAYVSLLKMDPYGVLLAFGAAKIASGLYYRTPFPIQPMKAIGAVATTQAAQSAIITPQAVYAAGLVTGAIWLVLGLTGTAKTVAAWVSRSVAVGIILGLGLSFMLEGIRIMSQGWIVAGVALAGTLLLLTNRAIPAMFLLLLGGAAVALVQNPALVGQLAAIHAQFRLASFALGGLSWHELLVGAAFLALPQVPLTLDNAIVAVKEENNRLFPERPVSEREVAVSTGVMNLLAPLVGGVPMCHGAGGMAGHVRFGARTGGALVILGAIVLAIALFFSGSVETIFRIFPAPILGVILFLTGAQLALGACDLGRTKYDRFVSVVTAACAMWNIGLAFVFGIAVHHALRRGRVRL
ncbi:MAG: putative sulfate/molybdate transporter [Betaproteobacteria bacterium]|nr:putative sulfate/molybdate transporter [Betaproteobacteria bacterium]